MNHRKQHQYGNVSVFALVLVLVMAALSCVYLGWIELGDGVLERVPPTLKIDKAEELQGFGMEPLPVTIQVEDTGMGIDEIVVRGEQRRERFDIASKKLAGEHNAEFTFNLGGRDSPFEEGPVSIEIKVFDRSFWSNSTETDLNLTVDTHRPRVSVITNQHNAQEGGCQLVFYKAEDSNLKLSGVKVDKQRFYGFKAELIDPVFKNSDVFAAFYVVPANKSINERDVKLFAEDAVGNLSAINFYNHISKRKYRAVNISISEEFVNDKLEKILQPFKLEREELQDKSKESLFRLLGQQLWQDEEKKIERIIEEVGVTKFSTFSTYLSPGGVPNYRFGESLTYSWKGTPWLSMISSGFRMDASMASNVTAANDGTVIAVESFAAHGKTILVDHGGGLTTVYSGLESVLAAKGDHVTPERPIGTAGTSGLFFKPGVFFEVRMQAKPTTALEWWDSTWVRFHLLDRIKEAKKLLGLQVLKQIE